MKPNKPTLSICLTCRDNREKKYISRGGARLANKILKELNDEKALNVRGVKCMSNCNRSCVISITAKDCFTYVFGDIDPNKPEYISSLKELISSYSSTSDGFLKRDERPKIFQSNIIGRFPPIISDSSLITKFNHKK
tara:strand:- start:123 stop:533 length:411 start_codon:yes stop_codon:yes gene_type:complete